MSRKGDDALAMEVPKGISPDMLKRMHATMVRTRKFEEKTADLIMHRKEIITPCHLYIGQEAVAAGVCSALRKDDWVFSTHRSHGHYIAKGGDLKALMAELFCRKTGCSRGKGGSMHIAEPERGLPGSSAIVGGTIPIAVGAALGFSMQKKSSVAVAFFGDGAVQEGVFYESLNFASLKKLPVIFVCENNLYCTHLSIAACLADTDICRKAGVFGMPGLRIDGNNVAEVYKTASEVVEKARRNKGPTLIECMTYRWRGHVGPSDDLDMGLRNKEELDCWTRKCPIRRLEKYMLENSIMSEQDKDRIHKSIAEEVDETVAFARESPYPDESDLLRDVFK